MHKQGVGEFPYYVGINSLEELATKDDRVVVLNILGKESSGVTPISNDYSGGNIVFGTGPGKSGKSLTTKNGKIPVYNSIKEGMAAGHKFNTVVVYLPPSGVKDGIAEAVRDTLILKKLLFSQKKLRLKIRALCELFARRMGWIFLEGTAWVLLIHGTMFVLEEHWVVMLLKNR